ncbi:hypothetical protein [Plantactinospora sp. KLBMP9567]|uniref:hypothetical protein n=1 Tax=Plantactinospora sp. KLBMP9567 TaxID=3085900 RepID=UPI0029820B1B|nr:hypothetical protein [Plantactinospora sp. KLBMP9567]MDW5328026.1 hypothetical protein [Plantactinospora sp. KLBMP9567]
MPGRRGATPTRARPDTPSPSGRHPGRSPPPAGRAGSLSHPDPLRPAGYLLARFGNHAGLALAALTVLWVASVVLGPVP